MRRAVKQAHAEFSLEPLNGNREGRLDIVESSRCLGEAAVFGHGHEVLKLSELNGARLVIRQSNDCSL